MNAGAKPKPEEGTVKAALRFWLPVILVVLVVRTFLFQPFHIPSGSMMATLLVGDSLFVSKFSYGYSRYSLPFSPAAFFRPHLRLVAPAWRYRRSSGQPRDEFGRSDQAHHRPARATASR